MKTTLGRVRREIRTIGEVCPHCLHSLSDSVEVHVDEHVAELSCPDCREPLTPDQLLPDRRTAAEILHERLHAAELKLAAREREDRRIDAARRLLRDPLAKVRLGAHVRGLPQSAERDILQQLLEALGVEVPTLRLVGEVAGG